jgi:hypothetical protein
MNVVPRRKSPPLRGTSLRVTECGIGYVEELLLEFEELFEDELELEFEELFEDEFELEFEELLEELFEDEFELEFEELLEELFEDEFEELLDELFEDELLLVFEDPLFRMPGRLRASVQPWATSGLAPATSRTASAGSVTGAVVISSAFT